MEQKLKVRKYYHENTHTLCPVLGLHANGPVQPDDLSIDHGVLSQWCHQVGELRGVPEAWRKGHLPSQEGSHLLWETGEEGSGKQTWRDKQRSDSRNILTWLLRFWDTLHPKSLTLKYFFADEMDFCVF